MKIKLLTSIVLGSNLKSYSIGEVIELEDDLCKSLINCRYAEEFKESVIDKEEEEKVKTTKTKKAKAKKSE